MSVAYDTNGQTQQQMIASLAKYVAAHGGNLDQVAFAPDSNVRGYFIVSVGAQRTQYNFWINTRTDTVTVDAGTVLT